MKNEFEKELNLLKTEGLKTNPLRLEYEEKVRNLLQFKEKLLSQNIPLEDVAKILHHERRNLGKLYKDVAPPLFREYILYATKEKYGDPLGPKYDVLRLKKSPEDIINSATRPIENLDDRLTIEGFTKWFYQQYNNLL